MFDIGDVALSLRPLGGRGALAAADTVLTWAAELGRVERALSDAERVDLLGALEHLKSAAEAAQARVTADFVASQRDQQRARGAEGAEVGTGIAAQVALARRVSPHRGARLVGLAEALVGQMPHTLAALESGVLSEHRAQILVTQTACLSQADRARVDEELCQDQERLAGLGNQRLEAEVKKAAYRVDPHAALARARYAERERSVSIRPAPDTMVWLTALLPVAQGVSCYAALRAAAATGRARGDGRGRGQVMADTLVERVTGRERASGVPVRVGLVMTDHTLLADGSEPAQLEDYGPIPAGLARHLVTGADRAWVRRLFTAPDTGQLVGLDSRARFFPAGLAAFIRARDQRCRTPWCDAPIRHIDHIVPVIEGGRTSHQGGQGLCEGCNYAKQAQGWRASVLEVESRAGPHSVEITTPTGHTYPSRAPDPPGRIRRRRGSLRVDWVTDGPALMLSA